METGGEEMISFSFFFRAKVCFRRKKKEKEFLEVCTKQTRDSFALSKKSIEKARCGARTRETNKERASE